MIATIPLAIASRNQARSNKLISAPKTLITLNQDAAAFFNGLGVADDIRVVPNFVSPQVKPNLSHSVAMDRWLYVGRLTEDKGILELIQQWPRNHKLEVIGTGPLMGKLLELKHEQGLDLTITGRQTREQTVASISTATGLVIPSLWGEGIPTVALEALACGTPVVASSSIAASGLLTGGGGGATYTPSPSSNVGLRRAMEVIVGRSSRGRRCARATYDENFGANIWQTSIDSVYKDVACGVTR